LDTYEAKLNTDRQVTIDADGKIRIAMKLISGDPRRPVVLPLTMQELEALTKQAHDALQRHAADQLKAEHGRREWALQLKVQDLERRNKQKDQRIMQLEQQVERVHDVVHPDRATVAASPERPVFRGELESQHVVEIR
jgi:predicted RNase H-like nuclease (RuvC/YqgF family)